MLKILDFLKVESKQKNPLSAKVFYIEDFKAVIEDEYKETIHYHKDNGLKCESNQTAISVLFERGNCKGAQTANRAVFHVFENNSFLEIRDKYFSRACAILNFDLINKLQVDNEYKPSTTKYVSYIHYPHQHSKFCGICMEKFESYKEHIKSGKHKDKSKIEGDRVYKRLTSHFSSIRNTIGSAYELSDPISPESEESVKCYVPGFSGGLITKKQEKLSIEKCQYKNLSKKKVDSKSNLNKLETGHLSVKRKRDEPFSLSKSSSTIKSKKTNNCSNSASSNSNPNEHLNSGIIVYLHDCEDLSKTSEMTPNITSFKEKASSSLDKDKKLGYTSSGIVVSLKFERDITCNEEYGLNSG